MNYYLYQLNGDKTLYAYTLTGDESFHYFYKAFKENNNLLTEVDLLEHTERPDYSHVSVTTGPEYTHEYKENGTRTITGQEYEQKVRDIENNTASVRMYSALTSDFAKDHVNKNGYPDMTCEEAINYLKSLLDSNENPVSENAGSWEQAYKSFVLEGRFLNSGDTDLGYGYPVASSQKQSMYQIKHT